MSRLEWDKIGEHFYETGVSNGVFYPYDVESKKYTPGEAWNGLSSVSESPSGAEESKVFADNVKYLSLFSNEDFGCTVEAYTYPDGFAKCDGTAEIAKGISIAQQTRTAFGLCYKTIIGNDTESNDYGYKLHLIYGCKASPSERSYSTVNDSPEANTMSWEITTTPIPVENYKNTACLTIDSTKVDKETLKKIEDILYGTEEKDAELPLPADILAILNAAG